MIDETKTLKNEIWMMRRPIGSNLPFSRPGKKEAFWAIYNHEGRLPKHLYVPIGYLLMHGMRQE